MGDTTDLARRIESYLLGRGDVSESRVLGGDGFFLDGRLVAAVMDHGLCFPVGRDDWEGSVSDDGVHPLLFADRPVPGWVMVDSSVVAKDEALARWIEGSIARY